MNKIWLTLLVGGLLCAQDWAFADEMDVEAIAALKGMENQLLTDLGNMENKQLGNLNTTENSIQDLSGKIKDINQDIEKNIGSGGTDLSKLQKNKSLDYNSDLASAILSGSSGKDASNDLPTSEFSQKDKVDSFVTNSKDTNMINYYKQLAGTTSLGQASAQADFNNINNQMGVAQETLDKINDATTNATLKNSVDLLNRSQAQNNMIQLQILRNLAIANQQKAIEMQAEVNDAALNVQVLTYHPNQ